MFRRTRLRREIIRCEQMNRWHWIDLARDDPRFRVSCPVSHAASRSECPNASGDPKSPPAFQPHRQTPGPPQFRRPRRRLLGHHRQVRKWREREGRERESARASERVRASEGKRAGDRERERERERERLREGGREGGRLRERERERESSKERSDSERESR